MKLLIYPRHYLEGGPKTFMQYFYNICKKRNIDIYEGCANENKAEVIFGLNNQISPSFIMNERKNGVKYIHRANGVHLPGGPFLNWKEQNEMLRTNMQLADLVIFQSQYSKDVNEQFVCKVNKSVIIPNGVDLKVFYKKSRDIDFGQNFKHKILSVGAIFQDYHFDNLLKAAEAMPNYLFIFAGKIDTNYFLNKKRDINKEMNDRKNIMHLKPDHHPCKFIDIYNSCDVFVDLKNDTCCPNALLEAMACGMPTIAANKTGASELIGDAGVTYDYGDMDRVHFKTLNTDNLSIAIQRALINKEELSEKALKRVKEYDIDNIIQRYLKEMKNALTPIFEPKKLKKKMNKKIGFVLLNFKGASIRLRGLNIIKQFNNAEVYQEGEKYDALVFQKAFRPEDIKLAKEFKGKKIFDLCDDFYDLKAGLVDEESKKNCIEMTKLCDAVITSSNFLRDKAKQYNKNAIKIDDLIDDLPFRIGWHGLLCNINHLESIFPVLELIGRKYNGKLILRIIADWKSQGEKVKFFNQNFDIEKVEWEEKNIYEKLDDCDLFVSPFQKIDNWINSKSCGKIVYAFKAGLPVIASQISEYKELAYSKEFKAEQCHYVKFAESLEDWKFCIEEEINNKVNNFEHDTNYTNNIIKQWQSLLA